MTRLPRFTVLIALLSLLVMPALATASTVTLTDYNLTESELGGSSSPGVQLATYALVNQNWSTLFAEGQRVYAMNLIDDAGGFHQDQLAYTFVSTPQEVPVPEPGTLTLLGVGLLVASRRFRRPKG